MSPSSVREDLHANIVTLSNERARLLAERAGWIRRYDESKDGSSHKTRALTMMDSIGSDLAEVERSLDKLTDQLIEIDPEGVSFVYEAYDEKTDRTGVVVRRTQPRHLSFEVKFYAAGGRLDYSRRFSTAGIAESAADEWCNRV